MSNLYKVISDRFLQSPDLSSWRRPLSSGHTPACIQAVANWLASLGLPPGARVTAVVAVVVPEPEKMVDVAAMRSLLKDRLANYKLPKQIHLMAELPRNTMGKVQKNVLRDQFSLRA